MSHLSVRLLGGVEFSLDEGPPLPLAAGKASALLAYLAAEPNTLHTRQALASLLWPERADTDALSGLRYALSNLRTVLQDREASQPFLLVDRAHVQLNPEADVWVDVTAFRQQAVACETGAKDSVPPEKLDETLALYGGAFLQGFNLGDSLEFESWALQTREHLERQHLGLLYQLAAIQEAAGLHTKAAESYRMIIRSHPWDEEAHRLLMQVLVTSGQHAAAMMQYITCDQAMRDLGTEPSAETRALYQRIKRDQAMPGTMAAPATDPFVAREHEIARLGMALEQTLSGHGQVILVTGEAGSGKTALLKAFAQQALDRHPDLLVVGGQCNAYTGIGQPYQPFIESAQMLAENSETLPWVDQIGQEGQQRLQHAITDVVEALVQAAPYLLRRIIDPVALEQRLQAQETTSLPAYAWRKGLHANLRSNLDTERLEADRLFQQMTQFLITLARRHPLVLLLDDLQWIDASSTALLFHLARHLVRSRVLFVIAYRPGELNDRAEIGSHPLLGIVTELQRYAGNIDIDLDQVNERAFVKAYLEQDPLLQPNRLDEAFRTALARRTGGNPLFTIELLRSMQAHDELRRAEDDHWISSPTLNWDRLPKRVEAAIVGRIMRLPAEWHDWLTTASIEGEAFTAEVVAHVHGVATSTLLSTLSGLLGMGRGKQHLVQGEGVRWIGEGDHTRCLSRYRFRHILFQVYLYQQLDPVERARQHIAVGLALEDFYGGKPQGPTGHTAGGADQPTEWVRHATELARHFAAGGNPDKAAAYHLEAGRQAEYLASLQSAVMHYRQGLALLAGQPQTPARDQLRIYLYLALSAPFVSVNGWGGHERREAIQQALDILRANDWMKKDTAGISSLPDAERDALISALYAQADMLISHGELLPAIRLGQQMLALAGEQPSTSRAFAHRILGISYLFRGLFREAHAQLDASLALCQTLGNPDTLALFGADLEVGNRSTLAFALALTGYLDQGWDQATQALDRARHLQHARTLATALMFAGEVAVLRGDLSTLRALVGELMTVSQPKSLHLLRAYASAAKGYVQALEAPPGSQQIEASLDLIRQGMRVWETTDNQIGRGMWVVRLADACLQAGEINAGLKITRQALETPGHPVMYAALSRIHRLHGDLLLRQENPDRNAAATHLQRALDIAREQEAHALELRAALSLATLWESENPEKARRLIGDIYAWFTEGLDTPDLIAARRWRERGHIPTTAS